MSVTRDDIKNISRLARIKIEDSGIDKVCGDLNNILKFMEQLEQVDCSQIDDSMQYVTNLHEREDVAVPCDPSVMNNAPQKECNMFVVPKVIG